MVYEYSNPNSLKKYLENLELLKTDLDLIIDEKFQIYVAIDFYDIAHYCFPFANISRLRNKKYWINDKIRGTYLWDQISRSIVFFMLENIYHKPNILLPPYSIEAGDFIIMLEKELIKFAYNEKNRNLKEVNDRYLILLKEAQEKDDTTEVMRFLSEKATSLIYYYTRGFTTGFKWFFHILRNYFTTDIKNLFEDDTPIKKDFIMLISEKDKRHTAIKNQILNSLQHIKPIESKKLQNERDAEAIYSIYCANEIYSEYKKAFIFVSSANAIRRLRKEKGRELFELEISKDNYKYQFSMVRDIDFFLAAVLGIKGYLEHIKNEKSYISNIDLRKLRTSISEDINRIDNYLSYDPMIGGIVLEQMELYRSNEIIRLNERVKNIDLALLFQDFLPNVDTKSLVRIIDFNKKLLNKNILEGIRVIHDAYEHGTLREKLFQLNMELEKSRLNFVLKNVQYNEKALQVALFNYPFRLVIINNSRAQSIIDEIVEENALGKLEMIKTKNLPNDVIINIYSHLEDLSRIADELKSNEKYIIWQLIFLYICRYDLVDDIYNIYFESSNNQEKREFSYLYAHNFIRKMRKSEISDPDKFLQVISVCEEYGELNVENLEKDIDLDLVSQDCIDVEIEYEKNYIKLSSNMEKIRLDTNNLILYNKNSKLKDIYILRKDNRKLDILYFDFRFIHIKCMIFNRYIHDFGCLSPHNMFIQMRKFEDIYIPLVKNVDTDFYVAIIADYAYLLTLYECSPNYRDNLDRALKIMLDLKEYSSKQGDIYWGFVRDYILGMIYFKLSYISQDNEATSNACFYFEKSQNDIPEDAKYLKQIVYEKILKCRENVKN